MTIGMILSAIFGPRSARGPNVVKLPHVPDKVEPKQRTIDVLPHERARLEQIKRRADRKRNGVKESR